MAAAWRGNMAGIVWMMLLLCSPQLGLNVVAQSCTATSLCANNLCCSKYNYCGSTSDYCGDGCLSGPCTGSGSGSTPAPSGSGVGSIITEAVYNQFFLHTSDCSTNNFYTYSAFITAASSYGEFGNTGDDTTRRQELAAFFAQVSHETTGGWATAPDGQYAWGLCFITENGCPDVYCSNSATYPCAPGKNYCGRGPIQISWNYNYGQAGDALGQDLLNNPDLVATDGVVSWKTALWFWNTAQSPKPSAHSVMVGEWSPSSDDQAANRLPGFGVTTNIINGGLECGPNGNHDKEQDRIGFYERYCSILGVSPGNNVDCSNQTPWS